jgi:hypothetical protein
MKPLIVAAMAASLLLPQAALAARKPTKLEGMEYLKGEEADTLLGVEAFAR